MRLSAAITFHSLVRITTADECFVRKLAANAIYWLTLSIHDCVNRRFHQCRKIKCGYIFFRINIIHVFKWTLKNKLMHKIYYPLIGPYIFWWVLYVAFLIYKFVLNKCSRFCNLCKCRLKFMVITQLFCNSGLNRGSLFTNKNIFSFFKCYITLINHKKTFN